MIATERLTLKYQLQRREIELLYCSVWKMEMGERASEMMAYPGNGEESNLPERGQDNVHGSGAHAGLSTETTDR